MSDSPIIAAHGLNKSFDGKQVLKAITLAIPSGRIVGLVGANGCGKSTLLRHIVGIYLPSSGECRVFGTPAGELTNDHLALIGYVHQEGKLLNWMSVQEMINFVSDHYRHWNHDLIRGFLERFRLDGHDIVGDLSPGKRQQLAILLAIGHEPELLILDEPAAGLDPIARNDFLQMLLDIIQDDKRTILISSHILTDIEKVIDHVLIMQDGVLIRDCAFDDLLEEFVKIRMTSLNGSLPDTLPLKGVMSCERNDNQAIMVMKKFQDDLAPLEAELNCSLQVLPMNFEDIYQLLVEKDGSIS